MATMETSNLVYTVAISLFGLYFLSSFRAYWRLRHFKGPPLAAWSNLWYIRATFTGQTHLYLSDVNTKYGSLARIGPNTLVNCDENYFRKYNGPRSGYYRDDWYKAFRFGAEVDNVFSVVDNDSHAYLRKRVLSGYSGKDNPELEANIDTLLMTMFKSWKERYVSHGSTTKPMDMAQQMQYLTLDIITTLSFSEPFGWVSTDSDLYDYIATMAVNFPIMFLTSAVPFINDILRINWVQRLLAPSVKDKVGMGKIKAVSHKIITQRFADIESGKQEAHEVKNDMTASFINNKLTATQISDNALLAILAGSDTSATVIRSGLLFMLTQPHIIRKLQAECDEAHIPHGQVISYARTLELPYLQACVKESLRFYPAGAGLNPRIVPPQGDYFEGKFIPGGTIIGTSAWNLYRLNYDAYGPDANIFRPERWIDATTAAKAGDTFRLDRMEKAHELVFSYGDFKCLGYKLAQIEISKVMFEVVRRYDIGFIDGLKTMKSRNYGLFLQEDMWVRIEERQV